jgi:hypothetical protein
MLSERDSYLYLDLASVPREDKEAVVDLVRILVSLSFKARREGLLSLEEDVEAHRYAELAFFLSLITDGCEEDAIDDLSGLRMASERDVSHKFRLFVIRLGCLSLQRGISPRMAAIYLREAFGRDADLVGEVDDLVEAAVAGYPPEARGESASSSGTPPASRDSAAEPRIVMPFAREREGGCNELSRVDAGIAKLIEGGDRDVAVEALIEAEDSGRLFGLATGEARRIALVRGLYERVSLLEPGKGSAEAREALSSILNSIPDEAYASLLSRSRAEDPSLAARLEADSFRFEHIVKLDDRYVQKLLRELDDRVFVKALCGAPDPVRDKILKNMSTRTAALMKEDLDFLGPLPAAEVATSRRTILETIAALARQGEIVIP